MKQAWDVEALIDQFTLLPPEMTFIGGGEPYNQLGKAVLLKFFQYEGRFPEGVSEIPAEIREYLARQLSLSPEAIEEYDWAGRSIKVHRQQIRQWLGFSPTTVADQQALQRYSWPVCQDHGLRKKRESLIDITSVLFYDFETVRKSAHRSQKK